MAREMLCPECSFKMRLDNLRGTEFDMKNHKSIKLKFNLNALVCGKCGEILLRASQCAELDELLLKSLEDN